jgi:hypothetical protein
MARIVYGRRKRKECHVQESQVEENSYNRKSQRRVVDFQYLYRIVQIHTL